MKSESFSKDLEDQTAVWVLFGVGLFFDILGLLLINSICYDKEYINYTSVRESERFVSEYTVTEVNVFEKEEIDAIKKSIVENDNLNENPKKEAFTYSIYNKNNIKLSKKLNKTV